MKIFSLVKVFLIFLTFEEVYSSITNQCPVKRSTGCTTITVVQPRCQYNYVYPQREYKATLNIRTCIARRFFRIYWFVRSGGRRILLNCRNKEECSVKDSNLRGKRFLLEARIFIFNSEQKPTRRSIFVPIIFSKKSLSTIIDLVDRQKIQIADAIKVMRYLTSSNSITQNDAGTKKKLQLKVRIFLHKYIANKKNKNPITSNRWIPIGRTNTPNGVSKISMLAQSSMEPYREAFRNSLKTLLMKENVTSEYLSRLTRVVQTMAKSILLQAQANPQYDRKQIDYHLHNMTSKIWTLLKNMNSTGHRIHPKMFTQAYWSSWGNWSPCSKECKRKKYSTRSRTCFVNEDTYKACKGHSSEVRKCPCAPKPKPPKPTGPTVVKGVWASWGQWSLCSVTCGLGKEQRYRKCKSTKHEFRHADTIVKCEGSRQSTRSCITAACGSEKAEYKQFQGSSTTLSCKTDDNIVYKSLYWVSPHGKRYRPGKHAGRISVTKDGQLHIKHAHREDEGTYYCIIPISDGNIIGSAQIMVMTCEDDPCKNGGTCIEQKYEIISKPSSFVCTCPYGFRGSFCEEELKQLKRFLIVIPICAGVLMMTCMIIIASISLKKKKQFKPIEDKPRNWTEKNQILSKSDSKSKKKSKVEKKSKQNTSVVSGDDSLQEIAAKDIKELMSPVKTRKTNVSYKRQSVKQPEDRHYDEILSPANPEQSKYSYTRQPIANSGQSKRRGQLYPSTSEEIKKWYTSPNSNADYYTSPMQVNVYENYPVDGKPLYANFPESTRKTENQKKGEGKSIVEVKTNNGEYENMSSPLTGGSNLGSSDMGGFKLIHKSLTPSKNTIRRYPTAELPTDLADEQVFEERNMSNINAETEKYCHPADICGNQSLKLKVKNVANSSQEDFYNPDISHTNSELLFHRFKPKPSSKEDQFDCVLDFDYSRNNACSIPHEKKNHAFHNTIDRPKKNREFSISSNRQGKNNLELPKQEHFVQNRNVPPQPPFQSMQPPQLLWKTKASLSDMQMMKTIHNENFEDYLVYKDRRKCRSFTEKDVLEDNDDIVFQRCQPRSDSSDKQSEKETDGLTSTERFGSSRQSTSNAVDSPNDSKLRNISNNDDFDDEVTFNKQDARSSIFVPDNDDSDNDIVYHRKYLQKSIRKLAMGKDKDGEINSTEPTVTGVKKENKSTENRETKDEIYSYQRKSPGKNTDETLIDSTPQGFIPCEIEKEFSLAYSNEDTYCKVASPVTPKELLPGDDSSSLESSDTDNETVVSETEQSIGKIEEKT